MGLFGKKKPAEVPEAPMPAAAPMPEQAPAAPATGVPTDRVIQLRQQGMSNNQISETLQKEGYSSSQVYDAMSQADIKGIVEAPAEGAAPPGAPPMPVAPGAPAEIPSMPGMPPAPG